MIALQNISMHYGSRVLFDKVTLTLFGNNRYGLVGANGAGKTTLLHIITGQEQPHGGKIIITKHARLGWMQQDQHRYDTHRILDVVLQGNAHLWKALQEQNSLLLSEKITEQQGLRLIELEEKIAQYGGYQAESIAETILRGVGIAPEYHDKPLSVLSGGYKLRVLLAQALFASPDILLLDEPTNYLDIVTIAWLENYLVHEYEGLLIFTSHDHDFLNNVATHILDIDYAKVTEYSGNYEYCLKQKALVQEQKMQERRHTEREIERLNVFIERFRASPSRSSQSLSREKKVERMKEELPEHDISSRRAPSFNFTQKRPSGKDVLKVSKIRKSYDAKLVLQGISFTIQRGQKVALIGRNGIGKSTLLKIIMGSEKADSGTYEWGYEAHISYFAQEHKEMAQEHATVLAWLEAQNTKEPISKLRATLGSMLFSGNDVQKKVSSLSGGEKTRLIFAKIMLEQANILVLDEPTNHLDLEARQALADALVMYEGTVIFVSHDRHFVSTLANRIITLSTQGIKNFMGTYEEYSTSQ